MLCVLGEPWHVFGRGTSDVVVQSPEDSTGLQYPCCLTRRACPDWIHVVIVIFERTSESVPAMAFVSTFNPCLADNAVGHVKPDVNVLHVSEEFFGQSTSRLLEDVVWLPPSTNCFDSASQFCSMCKYFGEDICVYSSSVIMSPAVFVIHPGLMVCSPVHAAGRAG